MEHVIGDMYRFVISYCMLGISIVAGWLNNRYEWFDSTGDVILTLIGIVSGIFTIRWIIIRTRNIKEQGAIDKINKELEIKLKEFELKKYQKK